MTSTTQLYEIFRQHPRLTTDTRQLQEGDLFLALSGENFDGNQFAAKALESGAAYAIVDDATVVQSERYLLVEDGLAALQLLAREHRRQFNIPIVAITGSNGKTTTKELLANTLGSHYRTHFTQGNLNNHIGVPLTLLAMPFDTEVAIIEMGANHQREIAALCNIAEPTHGLITNIGEAHLEGFGGIEGVKIGKGELYDYLARHNGIAFVNTEEDHLEEMSSRIKRTIKYTLATTPSLTVPYYEVSPTALSPQITLSFLSQAGQEYLLKTQLSGRHNLQNISTAIAVGKYFKVPVDNIVTAIEDYVPRNNRSQWTEQDGVTYLLDAYNANPSSTSASLENFASLPNPRKIVILGDMLELGQASTAAHHRIAQLAHDLGFEQVYLVGPEYAKAAQSLSCPHFSNVEKLKAAKVRKQWQGATVLLKGSRGMKLEELLA